MSLNMIWRYLHFYEVFIMKKFLSFMLAFVMVVTTFVGIIPPLEVSAAEIIDDIPELTNPSVGSLHYLSSVAKYAYAEEDIVSGSSFRLEWDDVADYYTVYVKALDNEPNPGDEEPGELLYNKQASSGFNKNYLTISKSNLEDSVGKYIKVSIQGKNSNGDNTIRCDYYVYVTEEPPVVEDIDADVDGTEVYFTVETNLSAKYGVLLYADGYKLDMIDWEMDEYSSYIEYTGSHIFNQVGEREITVYALDEDGNIVDDSEEVITIEIDSLGQCGAPTITTSNNQKLEVGNSFKISWNKPTSPTGVTFKYNVYLNNGTTNALVAENLTTTSYTIPASKLSKEGTYVISVIAKATDYTQSDDDKAAINLTVTEVQENPDLTSVSGSVNGTVATFTVKGNADAKHGIVLYADGYKLDMISWSKSGTSTVTYTGSHTFNQTGTRNIEVYALDKDGNEISASEVTTTVTIVSLGQCGAPSITTANNQKIEVGNGFTISWGKPSTPTGVTFKYNVYLNNGTSNSLVAENLSTTSYTIPASKLSKAGTYVISVIAKATDYTQSDDDKAAINLTVTEVQENPDLTSVSGSVNGTVATFTVKGNADAKYGIVLYADGYKLDMISWSKSGTSTVTYTGSHTFNQTGTRNIEVYALDKDGNEVSGSKVTTTVNIISLGVISAPSITTTNNQKIEVGNSFKISWNKPTTPTGVTFKYNVYLNNGTTNSLVVENLSTTSYTIPASKLNKAGTYTISVIAMATDYTQSDDDKAAINLTVTEVQENPDLTSVSGSVNGTVATFTVKGNADAKYGIVLYADGYKLDMISWSKSGTSTVTYTGSHTFNQTGTRNIVVYALDNDGNEVSSSKVTTTVNIVSLGKCGAPSITTANNQKIEVGNSFTISWNKPSTPTGVTFKYNVYVWDGTNNTLVSENLTTTSCTIPASKLSKAGTYVISVIAKATDYTQSDDDDASINLTVTEVQENPDLTSVSGSVNGTVATFTVKGNADAKYGIVLYADGYKLDMISWSKSGTSTVTYTGSHTFNQTGTRNIVVYALDKNGNEVSESKVTTTVNIISLGVISAPSITTTNNQKIEVGNSFKISWTKPTTPTGVTFKYNVYVWDGTNNTLVGENLTTTSYTIPANKLSKAGTYAISVIAMATDYTQSDDDDATINLTVTEVKENPKLTSIDKTVNGTVATFTVKGNVDAKYGIVLYADGYKLDMISWSKSGTSTVTYTGSHTFNQTGTRNIVVYALDKDGNEVKTSGAYVSTTITINSLGVISAPSITTANNQKIEVGNSFKISWTKPTTPTGVTFKYNVYVWDGTNKTLVGENLTTTSYTIPANKLSKAGTYAISVIAMATDYTQSDDDDATINLIITDSSKKTLGTVVITSPTVGSYVDSGNELSITWKITGDVPDRYIVNITGVDSQHITVSGTTAKVAAGVLGGKGTYTISVTAEKEGYVSSIGRTSIIVECQHSQKTFIQYIYEDFKNVDATTHSVRVISKYTCDTCGATYEDRTNSTIKNESHIRDFETSDGGWTCRCGHYENKSFKSYTAYLQSDVNQPTYYDANLTVSYGLVYPSDEITVVGETDNAYLIEYSLDKGGVKTAFISKNYIDTRKYEKGSMTTVFVSGNPVTTISNSNKLYANLDELIVALGDYGEFVSQNGYQVTVVIKDSRNNNPYTLSIDLSQYKTKNWDDVYASQNTRSVVADFCVGAYVYLGNIFIELNELLELIGFVNNSNGWIPSNNTVDYDLVLIVNQIIYDGEQFDLQYEAMFNETFSKISSTLSYLTSFNTEGLLNNLDYKTDREIIASIKMSLLGNQYDSVANVVPSNDNIKSIQNLLSIMGDYGIDVIDAELDIFYDYTLDQLLKLDIGADTILNDGLLKGIDGVQNKLGKISFGLDVLDKVGKAGEACNATLTEIIIMAALADNYEKNMMILDSLIANSTGEMKLVYQKVKDELSQYYDDLTNGIFESIKKNENIQKEWANFALSFASSALESKIDMVALPYTLLLKGLNAIFMFNEMHDAQSGIFTIHYSLETAEKSLTEALERYRKNPTEDNKQTLIATAVIVGNLKIKGDEYCYDFVNHQSLKMLWELATGGLEEYGGTLERSNAYTEERLAIEALVRKLEAWK